MKKVNFLIVGQGIAGSILAHELIQAGKTVDIIDEGIELTSSNRAGGLYNPVTGRKMVKTWLADELFRNLESYYQYLERFYSGKFIFPTTIYRPFYSIEELNDWEAKAGMNEYGPYIKQIVSQTEKIAHIMDPYGGLKLSKCGYVDLPVMLKNMRRRFIKNEHLKETVFNYSDIEFLASGVQYHDTRADYLIFCEGPKAVSNPFWKHLPFKLVKGELLDIKTNDLPANKIINRGVFILPKGGVFRVGSTYDHKQLDYTPTTEGKTALKNRLEKLYSGNYKVVDQKAGVRPATYDRRPFIGFHSEHPEIGIFNGFGTKGVSLVPYFARQFVNYLTGTVELPPEVDIKRIN